MSEGLYLADFPASTLWIIRLYPFIYQICFPIIKLWITIFTDLHLAGSMRQSGLLQREGKASLCICQGRAYGG